MWAVSLTGAYQYQTGEHDNDLFPIVDDAVNLGSDVTFAGDCIVEGGRYCPLLNNVISDVGWTYMSIVPSGIEKVQYDDLRCFDVIIIEGENAPNPIGCTSRIMYLVIRKLGFDLLVVLRQEHGTYPDPNVMLIRHENGNQYTRFVPQE